MNNERSVLVWRHLFKGEGRVVIYGRETSGYVHSDRP